MQKGLIEQRESQISSLKEHVKLELPDYEDGICPFENPENTKIQGNQYLQSKIYNINMISFEKEISLYDKEIYFTKNFPNYVIQFYLV